MLLTCREAFLLTVFLFRFYFVQFVGQGRDCLRCRGVVEISPYEFAGHVRKEAVKKKRKKSANSKSNTDTTTNAQFQSRIKSNLARSSAVSSSSSSGGGSVGGRKSDSALYRIGTIPPLSAFINFGDIHHLFCHHNPVKMGELLRSDASTIDSDVDDDDLEVTRPAKPSSRAAVVPSRCMLCMIITASLLATG